MEKTIETEKITTSVATGERKGQLITQKSKKSAKG